MEELTPFEQFLGLLGYLKIGTSVEIPWLGIILLVTSCVLLILLYRLISRKISMEISRHGESPNFYNTIKFFLRVIILIVIVILTVVFLRINHEYVLIISGIFVTAITFASMKSINNFIVGIYLSITRPFSIGDYVDINGVEGIITEININHIHIKHRDASSSILPNMACLGAKIENFTISTNWYSRHISELNQAIENNSMQLAKKESSQLRLLNQKLREERNEMVSILKEVKAVQESFIKRKEAEEKEKQELKEEKRKERAKRKTDKINERAIDIFGTKVVKDDGKEKVKKAIQNKAKPVKSFDLPIRSIYTEEEKIVRYTFRVDLARDPKHNDQLLTQLCEEWTDEFEVTPRWYICEVGSMITYEIVILTPDPYDIIHFYDEFLEDLYQAMYSKN
ncbi:MAG: mechanosensitive ion channel [Candidatus Lokiarchaeota archaeon]|nr:mechanosensitive ion channel [Candidatus Lokiarchaeota archaeon]